MSNFKIDWNGKEVTREVENICEDAVMAGAKAIARDAKRLVSINTGGLKKSIHVKTFKKTGVFGAFVKAGEEGKEHIAGFVELGTPGTTTRKGKNRTPIKAKPYMRPALKKNKSKIKRAFENKLK